MRGGARSGVSFPVPIVVLRRTDEADTYKVVGYVRCAFACACFLLAARKISTKDPPMGRRDGQIHLVCRQGKEDDAEPRITRIGNWEKSVRGEICC